MFSGNKDKIPETREDLVSNEGDILYERTAINIVSEF